MNRCRLCVIPDTRPDTPFVEGVCSACISYAARPRIDWAARRLALLDLLDRHGGRCIVPSSGGKDSHYQVLKLLELGAKPIVVTATTCHLTPTGRANIDNLARHATTIEVTPNRSTRAKLNRIGLELVGDISWPEHVSIFTTPFRVAAALGIKLIFYGENPQNQYGGPPGSEEAVHLSARWRSEFGGFLGLRPIDVVGMHGITAADMADYTMPEISSITSVPRPHFEPGMGSGMIQDVRPAIEAHFLGQYLPWDSHANAEVARKGGMRWHLPCPASWWEFENLDNAQTGLHDHGMYRKYGFGRLAAQVAVDIRSGRMSRLKGLELVRERDGIFPERYAGVPLQEVLLRIGVSVDALAKSMDAFTNWDLFERVENCRPILKEPACSQSA